MQKDRGNPALIAIGGFAGSGKTAISRRLARELGLPRLGSDAIGRAIRASDGLREGKDHARWIAYDVLFYLAEEYLQSGVSTLLDMTMGWAFQWRQVEDILARRPEARFVPLLLRGPREVCLARIRRRYEEQPERYDPPEVYTTDQRMLDIWAYLERLDRSDVHWIDSCGTFEQVYAQVKAALLEQWGKQA
jgi:predicted kinase